MRTPRSVPKDLEALMDDDDQRGAKPAVKRRTKKPAKPTQSPSILESLFPEQCKRAQQRLSEVPQNDALARLISRRKDT